MIEPQTELRRLRDRCVPAWTGPRLAVVTLAALTLTDAEIARSLFITERSVRRHLHEASARVFEWTGTVGTRSALMSWFWVHSGCCTAGALHLLETGRLLECG